jgi:hypothetical protein
MLNRVPTWHSDGGLRTVCGKDDLPLLGGLKDPPLLLHLEPPVQLEAQHIRVSSGEKNKKPFLYLSNVSYPDPGFP